jgi:hypothetical protein
VDKGHQGLQYPLTGITTLPQRNPGMLKMSPLQASPPALNQLNSQQARARTIIVRMSSPHPCIPVQSEIRAGRRGLIGPEFQIWVLQASVNVDGPSPVAKSRHGPAGEWSLGMRQLGWTERKRVAVANQTLRKGNRIVNRVYASGSSLDVVSRRHPW